MKLSIILKYLLYFYFITLILFILDIVPILFDSMCYGIFVLIIGFLYLGEKLEEIRKGY